METPLRPARLHEIWHARCPVPTPLGIAIQLGWIENALSESGNIVLRSLPETADPLEPVQYHESKLPNSFRQGGSVPAIWARANGQQTRVIGLSWTNEYQAVIAMPRTGLARARDLRGRRIGIPRHDTLIDHSRAAALRGFESILGTEGMTLDDVEIVDLSDAQVPSVIRDGSVIATGNGRRGRYRYTSELHALSRGEVDAIYVKDISGAQVTHLLGAAIVANIGAHRDPTVRINNGLPRPLTISQYLLDHHPEIVRLLLTQVVLAGEWACTHRQTTTALVARETGWTEQWVRYGYGESVHMNLRLGLSPAWIAGLDTFKNFLAAQRLIDANFDMQDWIDPAPLSDVLDGLRKFSGAAIKPDAGDSPTQSQSTYH